MGDGNDGNQEKLEQEETGVPKRGSHYEVVLEERHLVAVFFAAVLLCALFFTLGFVLGRNQVRSSQAAPPPSEKKPAATQPAGPAAEDLSFYDRVEGKKPAEQVGASTDEAEKEATKPKVGPPAASPPIYLQVAAVTQEPDAKRLAQELQKLGFPTVIRPPRQDRFYRVQVGPFENAALAATAQRRLEAQGFRKIIKR